MEEVSCDFPGLPLCCCDKTLIKNKLGSKGFITSYWELAGHLGKPRQTGRQAGRKLDVGTEADFLRKLSLLA